MNIVCLDLEGVLVPEIWIAFAEESGIPELKRTTRDEPDYDKLMNWRIQILKEHGLGLKEIQETIAKIDPMPGAKEFLDELRSITQVIIISDTFTQFASPLMEKLGWPTIFCNSLEVAETGEITGFKMRCEQSKLTTVKALQSIGYDTIASGDSHNDLGMIQASKAGFLLEVQMLLRKSIRNFRHTRNIVSCLRQLKKHCKYRRIKDDFMQRDDCIESSFLYDINCGILIYTRNMEREQYEKDIDDRNWGDDCFETNRIRTCARAFAGGYFDLYTCSCKDL